MIEDKRICPHCGERLHRKPYLMSLDPDAPGLTEILKGEAGEAWRIFLTVALCLLVVLIVTGLRVTLGV